ncbi:Ubiquitin carboxyl-terminal hydrolase 12 [Hordeum vulgare]|nr:Ubiquitin carboxyl-terminal hydrolase 12 [Hordeum vulgare]
MAATTPGGDDVAGGYGDLPGLGPDDHIGLVVDDSGSSSYHSFDDDEDMEEEAALPMEDRVKLAEIWVANPTSSHHWTSGAGGGVVATEPTTVCTQESINFKKDKLKAVMKEEPMFEEAHNSCDESAWRNEEDDWLLFEDEDDGHESLSFVLPKGRKSRAKQRKPRILYNDKLEQPHQQLFIKGEKTFAIKKMRLEHTCPTNTNKSRISAKWLAKTYESLLRSDPTTSIHTLIDNCREKFGVDVARHMAYRAKNLVVEAVLGEHKKQYPRLRDYAQTIMDTNPGSRFVVTTVTPKPTTKIAHP